MDDANPPAPPGSPSPDASDAGSNADGTRSPRAQSLSGGTDISSDDLDDDDDDGRGGQPGLAQAEPGVGDGAADGHGHGDDSHLYEVSDNEEEEEGPNSRGGGFPDQRGSSVRTTEALSPHQSPISESAFQLGLSPGAAAGSSIAGAPDNTDERMADADGTAGYDDVFNGFDS